MKHLTIRVLNMLLQKGQENEHACFDIPQLLQRKCNLKESEESFEHETLISFYL